VHRARNLYAKLPESQRERVRHAYWQALDDAINERDAKHKFQALVDELDKGGYTAAARCLADDLDALIVHLRYPPRHRRRWRSQPARKVTGRGETKDQGDRPLPRRAKLPDARLGRP
jgi:transposase-like protein